MIVIEDLHKAFGAKQVLSGVSINVTKGEIFAIIGQSGVGKTVILRHIIGFLEPDRGRVSIEGARMDQASKQERERLRQRMGFLFQFGALINWLTVWENVALPLTEHRLLPLAEITERVDRILHELQLTDARDKYPDDLSGGMKKRAGLARAMIRNPEIILYDEPTTGLDPVMSMKISALIRTMQVNYSVTSVMVTHDMKSALYAADRIAMLYNGKIVQCGTPDEIRNSENPIVIQFINGNLEGPISV